MVELAKVGTVTRNETTENLSPEQLVKEAADADVIVCTWGTVTFSKEVVDKLPKLKLIAYGGGSLAGKVDDYVFEHENSLDKPVSVIIRAIPQGETKEMYYTIVRRKINL